MKFAFCALVFAGAAFGDVVTNWNAIMRETVRTEPAQVQARFAAMTHLAMHDAVSAITREYRPYLGVVTAPPGASPEAAAITAAHQVLRNCFPGHAATLDAEWSRSLSGVPNSPAKSAGIVAGQAAATAILAARAQDGSATPIPYIPQQGVGYWQPTPPAFASAVAANWGRVLPFGLARSEQFRPEPPPQLTSLRYWRDYREVKRMGDVLSTARTADNANVARYMALTSPTQLLNAVAVQLSNAHQLPISDSARAFALMNMAIADASFAVFEAKYHYNFWRPLTAIRAGDTDGNPRTEADPSFTSLINAPAYPSYPSGFGALTNAGRYVLEHLFGRSGHSFTLPVNPALPDTKLQYRNLRHLTDDVSDARVHGGIHFRFEQDAAEVLGERVGQHLVEHQLRQNCSGPCQGDNR
ncbi:MAG TPA: vanadium-dependent haloperoxidase [Bryobacteraceae bacterium]|nr:vanadium-dependent haloperoxidase [Bryobacteraceae bacterium]